MPDHEPILSEAALADLDEIWLYIATDNVRAADRVIDKIYETTYLLAENPGMGHKREDLTDKPVRFWNVYNYLIIYKAETRPIEIARVLNASRDVESILRSSAE